MVKRRTRYLEVGSSNPGPVLNFSLEIKNAHFLGYKPRGLAEQHGNSIKNYSSDNVPR